MAKTYYSSAWTGIVTVEEKIDLVPGFKEAWEDMMFVTGSDRWDTGITNERPKFEFNRIDLKDANNERSN